MNTAAVHHTSTLARFTVTGVSRVIAHQKREGRQHEGAKKVDTSSWWIADLQLRPSCSSFNAHTMGLAPSSTLVPALIGLPPGLDVAKHPFPATPAERTSTVGAKDIVSGNRRSPLVSLSRVGHLCIAVSAAVGLPLDDRTVDNQKNAA